MYSIARKYSVPNTSIPDTWLHLAILTERGTVILTTGYLIWQRARDQYAI